METALDSPIAPAEATRSGLDARGGDTLRTDTVRGDIAGVDTVRIGPAASETTVLERRALDALLSDAVRSGPETVFLLDAATGTIRWVSDRVRDLTGWEPREIIGDHIGDYDASPPTTSPTWHDVSPCVTAGQVIAHTGRIRCLDGTSRPVDVRLTRLGGDRMPTVVAVAREVEARIQVEEQLRERGTTLRTVIGALRDGVLVVDTEGIVELANPRAAELAGLPLDQILNRPVTDVLERRLDERGNRIPNDQSPLLRTLATGQAITGLVHGVQGPVPRWLLVNTAPIIDEKTGRTRGAVATNADITDLIQARAELQEVAARDVLTELPNRGRFKERLDAAVADTGALGHHMALLFLDLDGFKTVNDSLGHSHGDELLRHVGSRLGEQIRPDDFIARIGGDEFVVLLPHLGTDHADAVEAATRVADRIVGRLCEPFHLISQTVRISASVGISIAPSGRADAELLLRQADLAMYAAKEAGRGGYQLFDEHMDAAAQRTMLLDGELRRVVEDGDLELHLQPRIDLATGLLSGAEALLRWPSGRPNPVDTASIVATAERNGLIVPIGRWVLGEAIRLATVLHERGVFDAGMTLSVNISGIQLQRDDFVDELSALLAATDLAPGSITIELTESALVHDLGHAQRHLDALSRLGVPMAVDDFGTGYSSMAYLRDFPVRELKLDRSFVADIGRDPVAETIVEGVIGIARRLGIDTVAEGVERPDQLEFLRSTGCAHYQGFLESPALAPDDFIERYRPPGGPRRLAS